MGCERIVQFFFHAVLNIKLYHWQTRRYPRHMASDALFSALLESMDKFIETYIGRYKRPKFSDAFEVSVTQFNDDEIKDLLKEYVAFLTNELPQHLDIEADTDLLNIRDDILGTINKTLYLFTLS